MCMRECNKRWAYRVSMKEYVQEAIRTTRNECAEWVWKSSMLFATNAHKKKGKTRYSDTHFEWDSVLCVCTHFYYACSNCDSDKLLQTKGSFECSILRNFIADLKLETGAFILLICIMQLQWHLKIQKLSDNSLVMYNVALQRDISPATLPLDPKNVPHRPPNNFGQFDQYFSIPIVERGPIRGPFESPKHSRSTNHRKEKQKKEEQGIEKHVRG